MPNSEKYLENYSRLESDYLRTNTDKPKIGYICLRTPLEIIESLDALPLRIIPREGFDSADYSTIRSDGCSFCRTIPAVLKTDYYAGLSAVIAGACCDQQRRVMDTLSRDLEIPVILYGAPRTFESDEDYYLKEMAAAFDKLASKFGGKLSPDKIRQRLKIR
ncbi:MAG: 2-hydroxyacyl-CoA dehydratase, partial [FCB group bacterium]|nr:2-hydroxyacyl-CoA dehydratase [FCB group bacterium]